MSPRATTYTPPGGPRLTEFLDSLPVTTRWLSGHHVVWQTGQQNAPEGVGLEAKSHCSAFVASVAQTLGIYLLDPATFIHGQELLANAQADWLAGTSTAAGPTASDSDWTPLGGSADEGVFDDAVEAAGAGKLVLAIYKAPPTTDAEGKVHQHSGHVCIVRPPAPDAGGVGDAGPDVLSVGDTNYVHATMEKAFQDHPGAWPAAIQLYSHPTDLEQDATAANR